MSDYLTFLKIWQDEFFFQIKITCSSKIITVSNEIYSSNQYIDDLYNKLKIFLMKKSQKFYGKMVQEGIIQQRVFLCAFCIKIS